MRIRLLNDGQHSCIEGLEFPLEVRASVLEGHRLLKVHKCELIRIGGERSLMSEEYLTADHAYFTSDEYEVVTR
jgi:hypothetical protein